MEVFDKNQLKKLYQLPEDSAGEDNGQVTIIGGSSLFHGAPLLSLKVTSRVVDMVFFTSPEFSVGRVAEQIKSKLLSFIWVPWEEVEDYIAKSDAVLIGPGLMRFRSEKTRHSDRTEKCDRACQESREITERLLKRFPDKKWVIDAGSLQVMETAWIPKGAILTPNQKEFQMLFGKLSPEKAAKEHHCIIVLKGPETIVSDGQQTVIVKGGNPGLTKGAMGDIQAGLTAGLLAKNEPFLAASCAAYIIKSAADTLYSRMGTNYNADDLADEIPTLYFP